MNSLQDLNSYSSTSLTVADNRKATVKFDRVYPLTPLNQLFTIVSTTTVLDPGTNIIEIVNYSLANVRYRITVQNFGTPAFTGSTVSWASLPAGVTLTSGSGVYTLSGITRPGIWDLVKTITWNLPANYSSYPTWNLKSEIIYYDEALGQDVSVSWLSYDPTYYFRAQIAATSTMTVKGTYYRANGRSNTSFSATLTASGRRVARGASLFASGGTLTCNLTALIKGLTPRTYVSNQRTRIFSSNSPTVVLDGYPTWSTVTVNLTVSAGYFAFENSTYNGVDYTSATSYNATYSYSDSPSLGNLNSALQNVVYYPVKNQTSNVTFTFQVVINSSTTLITKTVNLNFGSAGTYTPESFTIYGNDWVPISTYLYSSGVFDAVLVGGQGGSGYEGGGGGGGGVVEVTNQTLIFPRWTTATNTTVGAGGIANSVSNGSTIASYKDGSAGGPTTMFGQTAYGGQGGYGRYNAYNYPPAYPTQPYVYTYNKSGGYSGNPTANNGGSRSGTLFSYSYTTINYGGGGGGAGGPGSSGTSSSNPGTGGSGILSTIYGGYLGAGQNGNAGDGESGFIFIKIRP